HGAVDPRHPNASAAQILIAQVVTYAPLGLYLTFVLPRISHVSLRALGLRAPTWGEIGIGLVGTVAMWVAVSGVGSAIEAISRHHDTETAVALMQHLHTTGEKILFFVVACVLAPMIEELTFRVFLYNALTRYVSVPVAIVISGLAFGIVHALGAATSQLFTVALPLAFGGMILAYVYARTRCYWASVTTHGCFNAIAVLAVFVFHAR
ncbi:MAG: CPBP family intramembrane metalloprotease, partial [Candidatus Eremiobacteraeota bacterium]|nr:CPBP family intramembrane metalloprotease [Candidatus Eremiobacteraeota bacterium]